MATAIHVAINCHGAMVNLKEPIVAKCIWHIGYVMRRHAKWHMCTKAGELGEAMLAFEFLKKKVYWSRSSSVKNSNPTGLRTRRHIAGKFLQILLVTLVSIVFLRAKRIVLLPCYCMGRVSY